MTQRHKWADVIIAMANGETIQYINSYGKFQDLVGSGKKLNPISNPDKEWRIKPKTIMIGDVEVSEPMREVPVVGSSYWVVDMQLTKSRSFNIWAGMAIENTWLQRGLIHLDEQSAIEHAQALIKVSGGTV